jgi:hypothetical protein
MAEMVAEIRVCPICLRALAMDEQHPEHEVAVLEIYKEGEEYTVRAKGRICAGPGHEFIVNAVRDCLNGGFKILTVRQWVTQQLQSWKWWSDLDFEVMKADAERRKAKIRESIERIRRWAAQRQNDPGAQRWAEKKIKELESELERIDRDLERTLRAIADARRMLYGE